MSLTAVQLAALLAGVSTDRLTANISTLSAFVTRHCGYTNYAEVAETTEQMFRDAGFGAVSRWELLDYDFTGYPLYYGLVNVVNIIAEIQGTLFPDKYIYITAHYDSYSYYCDYLENGYGSPAPGADDNASGVVAMLEMAKLIIDSGFKPLISIRFVAFSGEEVGLVGSSGYVADLVTANTDVQLVMNLDMIGSAATPESAVTLRLNRYDTDDNITDSGYSYADQVPAIMAANTIFANTYLHPIYNSPSSDSYIFWQAGYRALYFEERLRSAYYHWETDILSNLNITYLAEITKGILACLCEFSGMTSVSALTATNGATMIDYALSTLATIARHEAEINNLAGTYTRKAASVAATVQLTAVPNTITAITAVKSDNTTAALVYGGGTWALPLGEYVRLICGTEDDYFSLLEGTGSIVTSANGDYTLTFGSAPTWTNAELQDNWQSKIDLANEKIYNRIFSNLTSKASVDDIADIIAAIENPEALGLASDYKTLELIYVDLAGKIGNNEVFNRKLDYYQAQFEQEFTQAYSALDFGDYGYMFTTSMGRISR